MSADGSQPTIHTMSSANAPVTPLGDAGDQRVLLGGSAPTASPLLMGLTKVNRERTSPLIQHDSAEIAYVLSGAGWMVTDTTQHPFAPGDAMLIDVRCWHAIRAGEEPVEMLYVFAAVPTTRAHPTITP